MAELREFAQHKSEFASADTELIAISTDDPDHARKVAQEAAGGKINILMDPGHKVISSYGLYSDDEGTKRTLVLIDSKGNEVARQSTDGVDESKMPAEFLAKAKAAQ
jgi:peroxiredoxin